MIPEIQLNLVGKTIKDFHSICIMQLCGGFFVFSRFVHLDMFLSQTSELTYIPKRIVSLVPSQTELLYHLGLEDAVAGITKFCIHPAHWFQQKTRIGGTKSIHLASIAALQPDLIIANKEENVQEQVEALAANYPVWLTDINNLDDAIDMIRDIGNLTGTASKAIEISDSIARSFEANLSAPSSPIRTAYLIWKGPYMAAGKATFINDMMLKAGFANVLPQGTRYPEVTFTELAQLGVECVLLSSEPYPFSDKHIEEIQLQLPGVTVKLADGELFSWYGSRLMQSASYFKKLYIECREP